MTDKQMISKMFEMQIKLNDATFPEWRTANLAWHRAIAVEAAEALSSSSYKWWKFQEPDHANNIVEMVDIWHFLMSGILTSDKSNTIILLIEEAVAEQDLAFTEFELVRVNLDQMMVHAVNNAWTNVFYRLWDIWNGYYGLTIKDLFVHYMTKNVLNHFRQTHGYKTGEYKKIWNGQEDNVVAFSIASMLAVDDDFIDALNQELATTYNSLS